MVRPTRRRVTDPQIVQKLWNAISCIRQQKQISNRERIARYMQREFELRPTETNKHVDNAVADGLLDAYIAVGIKGSKVGLEQEGFKIPEPFDEFDKGDHDWYCFECHKPGEVLVCSDCWRVFHPGCVQKDDTSGPKFTCMVCKASRRKQRIKRKEVNKLLSYTVNRLKEKTRELHRIASKGEEDRFTRFIYCNMDLNSMESKCKARKYKYLEQFQADAQVIHHNVFICFGGPGSDCSGPSDGGNMAELARIMIRDCVYDLDEIRQCKDCYHHSNAKPKDWFCQPCRPAHELVYAKQRGFSFWPAKVIKITKEGYDVRFFGGWHQRAVIAKTSIKPIDINLRQLSIKRTSGFVKACEELKKHQKLMERFSEDLDNTTEAEVEEEEEEEEPPPKSKKTKSTPTPKKKKVPTATLR